MSLLTRNTRALTTALFLSLAVLLGSAALLALNTAHGADHRDGPATTANQPLDITDLYGFRSPTNNDDLVVALGVNGLVTPDQNGNVKFSSTGSYMIHVDNNGDLVDDATVKVTFDNSSPQKFTIAGLPAAVSGEVTAPGATPNVVTVGGIKAFAGLRDDPFFFDLTAFKKFVAGPYVPAAGLRSAADGAPANTFAGTNALYIALELPITALTGKTASNTGTIKAWASTDNGSGQLDRMGIPAINTVFSHTDAQKDAFNKGAPATDMASYLATVTTGTQGLRDAVDAVLNGPVGPEDNGPLGNLTAAQVAGALIPDIVTIDFSKPVVFPNGRQLTDDVIDTALQLILNRTKGITDAINANDKAFGTTFPFVADPFLPAAATASASPTVTPGNLPKTGGDPGSSSTNMLLELAMIAAGGILIVSGGSLIVARRSNR
ncbi:MAG: DUF4331 domain-containing protein [Chloroflexota bacterium]|nr:DUF4331 domain-containing protein [Chloroflexota bacterium]